MRSFPHFTNWQNHSRGGGGGGGGFFFLILQRSKVWQFFFVDSLIKQVRCTASQVAKKKFFSQRSASVVEWILGNICISGGSRKFWWGGILSTKPQKFGCLHRN